MAMSMRALTNRLNALKSTGPKTVKGKLKAAQNAIKHGLLAVGDVLEGENQREFNDLKVRLMAELGPVAEVEVLLASRIVTLVWRLRRVLQMEMEMMSYHSVDRFRAASAWRRGLDRDVTLGEVFAVSCDDGDAYSKLRRYEAHIDRALYRALHELERRQLVRQGKEVAAPEVVDVNVSVSKDAA